MHNYFKLWTWWNTCKEILVQKEKKETCDSYPYFPCVNNLIMFDISLPRIFVDDRYASIYFLHIVYTLLKITCIRYCIYFRAVDLTEIWTTQVNCVFIKTFSTNSQLSNGKCANRLRLLFHDTNKYWGSKNGHTVSTIIWILVC